jgi:maleate cis-trans isomerase
MASHPAPTRLGFLYPGYAAEDDYPRMAGMVGHDVSVHVVHTSVGEDAHRVDALLDLGGTERLLEGAATLKAQGVDAAVWACTSGSFVFGWDGARVQAREVADYLAVPASSTSLAFVHALRTLGIERVSVAATYPEDVASRFADYLASGGVRVLAVGSEDIITAAEVGTLGRERVRSFVAAGDHPDAQAVLVPDTALHTIEWLPQLEAMVGKPVLTANQVSMWEALRLVGRSPRVTGLGTLFASG